MRLRDLSGGVKFQSQKRNSCLNQRPLKMTICGQSGERRMHVTRQSLKHFGQLGCSGENFAHFSQKTSTLNRNNSSFAQHSAPNQNACNATLGQYASPPRHAPVVVASTSRPNSRLTSPHFAPIALVRQRCSSDLEVGTGEGDRDVLIPDLGGLDLAEWAKPE